MTSESSNIVNLRDTLPPLQQVASSPPAAPVPAHRRTGLPLGLKVMLALFVGAVGVAMVYLGYTGQWPSVAVAPFSAPSSDVLESTLPVTPPAPPQTAPADNPSDMPTRDVLYSINVPESVNASGSVAGPSASNTVAAQNVIHNATPRASTSENIQPEPQAPARPESLSPSPTTTASVSNDISLAYQNQARIEAIEGYIVEMLTVIESHKTELRAMQASLEKNTAAIDQQMQRVAALVTQSTAPKSASPTQSTTAPDSLNINLPFRVTSIRQFGEALSVRVEDARGVSRLMVPGQQLIGWQLVKVDPDRRRAEFIHLDSKRHQEAAL